MGSECVLFVWEFPLHPAQNTSLCLSPSLFTVTRSSFLSPSGVAWNTEELSPRDLRLDVRVLAAERAEPAQLPGDSSVPAAQEPGLQTVGQ